MTPEVERMRTRCELLLLRARDAISRCDCGRAALDTVAIEVHKLTLDNEIPYFVEGQSELRRLDK